MPPTDRARRDRKSARSRQFARLKRILPRFQKIRIAVLGDLMLDRYLWGTASRLSPEAAVPVVDFVSETDCPGGAGNVAANLAALGARVQVFGVLGGKKIGPEKVVDDEAGVVFRACLRRAGVTEQGIFCDPRRITTVKTRVIARHQQIVRIDRERKESLGAEAEERLFRLLLPSLKGVHALILSNYDKGLIDDGLSERVLHACHQLGVSVFVKPKTSGLVSYRGARVVVCNTKEAAFYVTRALGDEKSVEEAGRALLSHFGCAAVVITRGEKGMSIFEEDAPRPRHIPATSFEVTYERVGQSGMERGATGRQVFDVTGAGDTALGVLALGMAAGAALEDAALLANVAAGVVVGKLGTATISRAELAAAVEEIRP